MYRRRVLLLVLLISVSLLVFGPISNTPTYAQTAETYYPSAYNLFNETAFVSGWNNLQADDGNYTVYRSYPSATSGRTLYAHQETTTIAGTPYYLQKLESADGPATSLSASMSSSGRQLLGKFVYPLTGVTSIPASTWTVYYRTWASMPPSNVTNSPSNDTGLWTNPTYAYANDTNFASSSTRDQQHKYGGYGFNLPSAVSISQVRVRLDVKAATNDGIKLEVSTDGGATFLATTYTSPALTTTEQTIWVDVTGWITWTVDKINNDKIWTRVTQIKNASPDTTYLDWIPIEVTYTTPSFVAHADVDILILQSNGTIRATIAPNVANSANLTTTAQTLEGTYSWSAYTVVDQTDYLEIDCYIDVTTAQPDATAYLRIDDNSLPPADQTRATNIMLPSEYTMEVEFTGSSDMFNWTQLVWTIDSAWTTGSVSVTLQLYNYTLGAYPTSGDGYIAYTSSATPNTDETENQTITTDPTSFRNSADSSWKVKIKGVKTTTTPFDFEADLIKYETTTVALSDVAVFGVTPSATEAYPTWTVPLNITVVVVNEGALNETFWVAVYFNLTSTEWVMIGNQTVSDLPALTNETLTFVWDTTGVPPSVVGGNYTIYTFNATASTVPFEVDTGDNVLVEGAVWLKLPGDVDGNGRVTGLDQIIVGIHLWEIFPDYNPAADVDGNGRVTGLDQIIVGIHLWEII